MKSCTPRRVVVCLLAIVLGIGMTLSAVQASDMTVGMTLAGDMTSSGTGGCDGCGGGDDAADSGTCQSLCVSSGFVLSTPATSARLPDPTPPRLGVAAVPSGAAFTPDPYPPRPIFLS